MKLEIMKRLLFLCSAFTAFATSPGTVLGAEGGQGVYLLGIRGQGAGITPPPGIFFVNQVFFRHGEYDGVFPLSGGGVGVGVELDVIANLPTAILVTPVEIFGGDLGFTATAPFGSVDVSVAAGPRSGNDDVFTFADPSISTFLGWHSGNLHTQLGIAAYLPIGDYQEGELANVAKHYFATDLSAAITYFDPESGVDFTNVVGVTFNTGNRATDYRTGTEFHWEGALTEKFSPEFSAGFVGFYYNQLTGDSGSGAVLGPFQGEVFAAGLTAGYDFTMGKIPVSTKFRYYHDFYTRNRLEGDSLFAAVSMPLTVFQPQDNGK